MEHHHPSICISQGQQEGASVILIQSPDLITNDLGATTRRLRPPPTANLRMAAVTFLLQFTTDTTTSSSSSHSPLLALHSTMATQLALWISEVVCLTTLPPAMTRPATRHRPRSFILPLWAVRLTTSHRPMPHHRCYPTTSAPTVLLPAWWVPMLATQVTPEAQHRIVAPTTTLGVMGTLKPLQVCISLPDPPYLQHRRRA